MGDWKDRLNVVYSTNPEFKYETASDESENTLAPDKQNLKVWIDSKNRGGKKVSIVRDFVGSDDDLNELCRTLKVKCGVGGAAKDGEIIIQGDFRDRIVQLLLAMGYKAKKAGG